MMKNRIRKDLKNSNSFAFLGNKLWLFIIIVVLATIGIIIEKYFNYNYVIVQKYVQSGFVYDNWTQYMKLGIITAVISLTLIVMKVFFIMWTEMIQQINFFKHYDGVIQQEGKFQAALKDFVCESTRVHSIIEGIETVINSVYVILLMGIVSMSMTEYVGVVCILFLGIILGVFRGKLQARTDFLNAELQGYKQKLSTSYMISDNVLGDRLKSVEGNYWKRMILQCVKNAIQKMPEVMKVFMFVVLFYNIILTSIPENEIYPYTYVIMTAYGYIVILSGNISNLIEYISKIILYKNDLELQEIRNEMELRLIEINENKKNIIRKENGFTITTKFSLNLIRPNGHKVSYTVPNELNLNSKEVVYLQGENGTGKSRLSRAITSIIPNTYSYDVRTGCMDKLAENFLSQKYSIDFEFIKYLAKGLGIERIPNSKKDFLNLNCSSINSADRQMLIALQILYFAIKDKDSLKVVILDEIFANLSLDRTKRVLPFIISELQNVNACIIIVSHSHIDEVIKYATKRWNLENTEREVIIKENPV